MVPTSNLRIITKSTGTLTAELTGENPETAKAFVSKLPMEGEANTWGDEIYFTIPVDIGEESPKAVVEIGDIAYVKNGGTANIESRSV